MAKFIDLTGKRFGRLTARAPDYVVLSSGRKMAAWLCTCDCGASKVIQGHHLRGGVTRSCGCALHEEKKPGGERKKWPGYGTWWQMIQRCRNPKVKSYKHYGARGIRVCPRWEYGENGLSGFECFFDDMGAPPSGLSLDRLDPDGNYEPGNCRWATGFQQRTNTRRSHHAVIGGVKVPLLTYAHRLGLNYEGLRVKVSRRGMSVTEAARETLRNKAGMP